MTRRAVAVVGIGDDGCAGLSSRSANAVACADVLVGGERQLAFFPQFRGERLLIKAGIDRVLARVAELSNEHSVCVLASGDPLFFGVGSRVAAAVGAEHVEFLPAPSSVQWAFARAGLAWDDAEIVSVHGRSVQGVVARLRGARKAAILTDAENGPARLAARFLEFGDSAWQAWVCERLSGPGERVRRFSLAELAEASDIDALSVLLLCRPENWRPPPLMPFLNEDTLGKRMPKQGLITKREVRLLSLAELQLRRDSVVWDVGAGSGSVAIEAALLAPEGKVFAVELDPESCEHCEANARAHGADNVFVLCGRAPDALRGLERPDAVFVGGSKGSLSVIIESALAALKSDGRLVINAVTLENVAEAYAALRGHGLSPAVTLLQVSRAAPLAHYLRYEALNPIHIFSVTRPPHASEEAR